jgi:hypothetical protein
MCEGLYNKYGLNPLDCDKVPTAEEVAKVEQATGQIYPTNQEAAAVACNAECNGDPECIKECVENHPSTAIDRCTRKCVDHGLQIKPIKASMNCHSSKEATFSASGGKSPYKWSSSAGVLTISGDKQESAKLKADANPGSAIVGAAYRVYRGCWAPACAAIDAVFQDFKCDDTQNSVCQADATTSESSYPCEGLQIHPCAAVNGGMPVCQGSGSQACHSANCPEFEGALDNATPCSSCSPSGGEGRVCDSRTAQMIAQGCAPCGIVFKNGGTVTVTDSKGRSATAVVTL